MSKLNEFCCDRCGLDVGSDCLRTCGDCGMMLCIFDCYEPHMYQEEMRASA